MSKEILEELNNTFDCVNDPQKLVSEYRFNLKGIDTTIAIRIFVSLRGFIAIGSHGIQLPDQANPNYVNDLPQDDETKALKSAIENFRFWYEKAPSEAKLVPSNIFPG